MIPSTVLVTERSTKSTSLLGECFKRGKVSMAPLLNRLLIRETVNVDQGPRLFFMHNCEYDDM